jgi:ADP-heptose:LPS heptosyltransferase
MANSPAQPPATSHQPRRILVRSTNWLGDAVMTTPALLRLREQFPEAHIALLTPEKLRDLWLHHPAVDETIAYESGKNIFSVGRRLRVGGFDLALVLPNSPRSALETWLAGIPQRIGYARPWRSVFLTQAVPARAGGVKMRKRSVHEIKSLVGPGQGGASGTPALHPGNHQIHEYLHLAAALGANPEPLPPQLTVTPGEIEAVKMKFGLTGITQPVFGLNPGAEYGPAKRWPVVYFIAAARQIQQRTPCAWIVFGGKRDVFLTNQSQAALCKQSKVFNLAGITSLRELMALLKLCRVLLTNDTGPMHVAAALGTPVVVPFGSTSPELTGPGLPGDARHRLMKSDAPCSPCFLRECPINFRCMNGISVERVVEAVLAAQTS